MNTYSYVLNNPLFYSDPTGYGMFPLVIINESGQIGQQGHNNASVTVIGGRKGLISPRYPGSSLPGNPKRCATVAGGVYPFTVEYHSDREQTILRIPGNVPVVGGVNPNPNSDSARGRNGAPVGTANGVLNHPSNINTTNDNGLCGCMGVRRDRYGDFISNFLEGDSGTEIIIRPPAIRIPVPEGMPDPELDMVIY